MQIVNSCFIGILMLVWVLNTGFTTHEGDGYKLVKNDQQIALYERWVINDQKHQVRELKAVFKIKAGLPAICSLLTDASKGASWNKYARVYQIQGNQREWFTYIRYRTPWPFGDQDCCLRYQFNMQEANPSTVQLQFESALHQQFPEQSSTTRITGIKGSWLLTKSTNNQIDVVYQISSHKSASIPRWVSDPIVRNNIIDSMDAFRQLLEN